MTDPLPWQGDLLLRPGVIAFTGHLGAAARHTHAAVQVYVCTRGEVTVRADDGTAVTAAAVVVPAGSGHEVTAGPGTVATTVFLDPSGTWAPEPGAWTGSVEGWADEDRSAFARTTVTTTLAARHPDAERFGRTVEDWVRSRLPDPVTVPELAAALAISEPTLRRLARTELGLGVNAYARWVRLIVALEQIAIGASITDAAAAAGFADGSHATRACREMFGLTPSDAIAHLAITRT